MNSRPLELAYSVLVGVLFVVGLRFVSQSGLGDSLIQNDGYTVSGSVMLFVAGISLWIGIMVSRSKNKSNK